MIKKLENIKLRFNEIEKKISDPVVIGDRNEYQKVTKEHSTLFPIVEEYNKYIALADELKDAEELRNAENEQEMLKLLNEEISKLKQKLEETEKELKMLLLPKDPNDDKNIIVEIRGGAGGDEACLFATVLRRMYYMYGEKNRWKIEEISINENELGGIKEVVFSMNGKDAYSKLKYESGVHRVQRVPETESQGRIHTSTATVAVLPEVDDVEVQLEEKDLKIDKFRSSGAGGQHVNKTESAIRVTHLPTGIVVVCEDERSQTQNKEKALKVLKSRLYDYYLSISEKEYSENRRMQVGSGDRSERIRTYNYPQGRVTDHRIGLTIYNLENFLNGSLEEMIESLQLADKNAKLSSSEGKD